MSGFSESAHPRQPAGSENGGEFAPKYVAGVSGYSEPKARFGFEDGENSDLSDHEIRTITKKYLGKSLGEKDLYEIAGILPGSKIKHLLISKDTRLNEMEIEISSKVIRPARPNPKSPSDLGGDEAGFQTRTIDLKNKIIKNDNFFLDPDQQSQGLALKALTMQVRAARAAGFNFIMTKAAGQGPGESIRDQRAEGIKNPRPPRESNPTAGYYVWPRLGFVPAASGGTVGAAGKSNINLTKLMMTKQGRDWWKMHGTSNTLKFDLADGSISRRVLDAYAKEKGV